MSEQEPSMKLQMPDRVFEARRDNSSLWLYLGNLACYSNVFLETGEEADGTMPGTYIFAHSPAFDEMKDFMLENCYPVHANLNRVPKCDQEAYEKLIQEQSSDIGDTIPEGWDDGTES